MTASTGTELLQKPRSRLHGVLTPTTPGLHPTWLLKGDSSSRFPYRASSSLTSRARADGSRGPRATTWAPWLCSRVSTRTASVDTLSTRCTLCNIWAKGKGGGKKKSRTMLESPLLHYCIPPHFLLTLTGGSVFGIQSETSCPC